MGIESEFKSNRALRHYRVRDEDPIKVDGEKTDMFGNLNCTGEASATKLRILRTSIGWIKKEVFCYSGQPGRNLR